MSVELWQQCVELLRDELPAQQFNTWIRPLQVEGDGDELRVYAPNRFVLDWVNEKYLSRLLELLSERSTGLAPALSLLIGSKRTSAAALPSAAAAARAQPQPSRPRPLRRYNSRPPASSRWLPRHRSRSRRVPSGPCRSKVALSTPVI